MNVAIKSIYIIEAVVCFAFPAFAVLVGIVFSPFLLVFGATGSIEMITLLLSLFGGFVGLTGIYDLVLKVLSPQTEKFNAKRTKLCISVGVLAILNPYIWSNEPSTATIFGIVLPLGGALHFIYLCRSYLWQNTANQ